MYFLSLTEQTSLLRTNCRSNFVLVEDFDSLLGALQLSHH